MNWHAKQVEKRLGQSPDEWLVNGGFSAQEQTDAVASKTEVYAPVPEPIVESTMQTDVPCQQIEHLKATQAVLLFFLVDTSTQCVRPSIKPKLERLMKQRYSEVTQVYVDCSDHPDTCAQHGVFSLPVVQLYIEGHLYLERGRSFNLVELGDEIDRIHRLWKFAPH